MEREIKLFAACPCRLSESPMWNDQDKMLYWRGLDGEIFRKKEKRNSYIFRYNVWVL